MANIRKNLGHGWSVKLSGTGKEMEMLIVGPRVSVALDAEDIRRLRELMNDPLSWADAEEPS